MLNISKFKTIGLLASLVIFIVVIIFIIFGGVGGTGLKAKKIIDRIELHDNQNSMTIWKNGHTEYKTPDKTDNQALDENKIRQLFDKIPGEDPLICKDKASLPSEGGYLIVVTSDGSDCFISISGNDEASNQIISAIKELAKESAVNNDVSGYFTSSPISSSVGQGQSGGSSGGGGSGGGSGGGPPGPPSDCLFWVISMCLRYRRPPPTGGLQASPTPPPSSTPLPSASSGIVPDCDLWGQVVTGRTVISNTLCLRSPSN